jgi:hypothetical protein
MSSHGARRDIPPQAQWRLALGFLLAPVVAALVMFLSYLAVWNLGIDPFNPNTWEPYDTAGALTAGVAIGAVFVTVVGAIPGVLWLATRGPLPLWKITALGSVLGFLFSVPMLIAGHHDEFVRNAIFGLWVGGLSAAAFWVIAVPGTDLSPKAAKDRALV